MLKHYTLFKLHHKLLSRCIDLLGNTHRQTRNTHSTAESEGFSDTFTVISLLFWLVHSAQFFCCCYAQVGYF